MRLHVMSHLNSVIIRNIPFNLHLLSSIYYVTFQLSLQALRIQLKMQK